jgi:carbon-monoxide dehydrogenase large subunit
MESPGDDQVGRFEDRRFTTGRGSFTGDRRRDGVLHARFVRAAIACGRLRSVDVSAARSAPGVVAVFTADDLARDGIFDLAADIDPPRDDGCSGFRTARPFLARERVRFVGEPLALVVAETAMAAADAAALVAPDIQAEPAIVSRADALAPGAPRVWPEMPDNIAFVRRFGDEPAVRDSVGRAAHVTRLSLDVSRVVAATLEPRAALGESDTAGRLVLTTSTQAPFALRNRLADEVFHVDRSAIRVIAPDIGGSFGMKGGVYREDVLVLWAARKLRRPVLWVADRTEAFLADEHGRDVHAEAELALNERGEFTALSVRFAVIVGAYLSRRSFFMVNNIGGIAGVYRTPSVFAEVMGYHTNTGQTGPYRGAGRPEVTLVIERLIDQAARELAIDPFELRRRNVVMPEQMPFDYLIFL